MERTLNTGHSHGGIVTAYLQLAYDQRRVRHFHAILFFDKNRFKIQNHWKDFEVLCSVTMIRYHKRANYNFVTKQFMLS